MTTGVAKLIPVVMLIACTTRPPGRDEEMESLKLRVKKLEFQLQWMEAKLDPTYEAVSGLLPGHRWISTTSPSYAVVPTSHGPLLARFVSASPVGDGQRVMLAIGNPHNIYFRGVKIRLKHGPRRPDTSKPGSTHGEEEGAAASDPSLEAWRNALKERAVEVPTTLTPGEWTTISVIVAPAGPADIGHLEIAIEPDRVALRGE